MAKQKPVKIIQIGHSLGFRIPKKSFDVMNIKKGDKLKLDVDLQKKKFTLTKKRRKQ